MTLALLLVFVVPFWLAIGTIVQNSGQILSWAESVASAEIPPPPAWLGDLPLVGPRAASAWQDVADSGVRELLQKARPYAGTMTQWFVSAVGSFGMVLVQFLLTVAVSAIMYAKGEAAAALAVRFGRRLAGERGGQSMRLAAQAIRGVALGVVVTALIQSAIGGLGLAIAGVPFASVLCAVMFMLCIAQIGPAPVLVPAVVWMFVSDDPAWAICLLVFSVLAIGIDNVVRPILIRRGADLPLLLILAGVVGGLMAFGLIGLFLGPTVLAVAYTLLGAWIDEVEPGGAG
jgi:predicted PurR-regulated permease PerM